MCAAGFVLSFSGCIGAKEKAAHIVGYVCCMTNHCVERRIRSFVRVFLVKKKNLSFCCFIIISNQRFGGSKVLVVLAVDRDS
jgi:hypothetical protein